MLISGIPTIANINPLQADVRYYFQVIFVDDFGGAQISTDVYHFRTQRSVSESFTFTVTADIHWFDTSKLQLNILEQSLEGVAAQNPDFHVDLGTCFFPISLAKWSVLH